MADPPDDNKVLSPQKRFSRLKQIFSPEKRGTDLGSSVSQLVVFAETVLQVNLYRNIYIYQVYLFNI